MFYKATIDDSISMSPEFTLAVVGRIIRLLFIDRDNWRLISTNLEAGALLDFPEVVAAEIQTDQQVLALSHINI